MVRLGSVLEINPHPSSSAQDPQSVRAFGTWHRSATDSVVVSAEAELGRPGAAHTRALIGVGRAPPINAAPVSWELPTEPSRAQGELSSAGPRAGWELLTEPSRAQSEVEAVN